MIVFPAWTLSVFAVITIFNIAMLWAIRKENREFSAIEKRCERLMRKITAICGDEKTWN